MPIQLPKKSPTEVRSKYELLGLRDMPFPSDGFVDPYSTDPRTNGSIYAVSTAQSEGFCAVAWHAGEVRRCR
jgi:hypothetical protein